MWNDLPPVSVMESLVTLALRDLETYLTNHRGKYIIVKIIQTHALPVSYLYKRETYIEHNPYSSTLKHVFLF